MMNYIKTVFIDLDDTLWWFTENSKVALEYVYDSFNLNEFCADYDVFKAEYLKKNNELWELYHYGKIDKFFLKTERFRYVLDLFGAKGDILKLGKEIDNEYLNFLALQTRLVNGAEDLLKYLTNKYEVNVLSNGFKGIQLQKLKSGGIDGYINQLILSDDCGVTKPLPGIFEYAMKKCSTSAEFSIMIGDNYDADIVGANNMGWKTIFYNKNNESEDKFDKADYCVSFLSEVKNIL